MAYVAVATNVGTRKQVNEDSCCIKVAETSLGEVTMALVCDGVGGLSAGNLASATVVNRFSQWFDGELPMLMEGMAADAGAFDFNTIKAVWGALLQTLNDLVYTHGTTMGMRLGTTLTAVITCGGRYLVCHVGDCRAYRMGSGFFEQLTEDQTKVARMLAAGEITAEEAARMPKNVILQSVGTQRTIAPVFSEGSCSDEDLFVICCDGAYHRSENEGIRRMFQKLDFKDERALNDACNELIQLDLQLGEKDNLTVVCFCTAPAEAGAVEVEPTAGACAEIGHDVGDEDELPTMVETEPESEDELPTMVEAEPETEDELPTMVEVAEPESEDDLPTMVESESEEDELPTMVEDETETEDELPTMIEAEPEPEEDDLPTMVESSEPEEDDLPTMVEAEPEEDDLPTMVEASETEEDELPTIVEAEPEPEDDLPTMVEGADA